MNKPLNTDDLTTTLTLFQQQLDSGKKLNELPIKYIDWNSVEGMHFLKERCRKGNSEDIIKQFRLLKLNEKNGKFVLAAAVRNGVSIGMLPIDHIVKNTKGNEKERNDLINTIIECGGAREFLALLRSDRTIHGDKKYEVYDYVVVEYKKRGLGQLPNSEVVFGMDFEDEKREENERKKHLTKEKMDFLTKKLKEEGVNGIRTLWRMDNGLGILHYPNAEDVRDYPDFIKALTRVVERAIEKDFEETYKCVRTFPLLYGGGAMAHIVPDVIDKAFKKYIMMLKSIERNFCDEVNEKVKQDYFFFTKIAVTNPKFNWNDINLAMLPEEGLTIYNEKDEPIVLSLREQLDELVISAYESGIGGFEIPNEYASYDPDNIGVLKILVKWSNAGKKKEQNTENNGVQKQPGQSIFNRIGRISDIFHRTRR